MTDYLKKTFTVGMPTGQKYRDNWDAVFGKKPAEDQGRTRTAVSVNDEQRLLVLLEDGSYRVETDAEYRARVNEPSP